MKAENRKLQIKITGMKNFVDEMKHLQQALTSRVRTAEYKISELQDELYYNYIQ